MMENESTLRKIYITPIIPTLRLTSVDTHFKAFGPIDSCTRDPYEICVQYTNVESAKTAMSNFNHCIEGKNVTIRWKPHILDLDPFCLIEVFEHLNIDDLCGLRETCTTFKDIAEKVFILKYANDVLLTTSTGSGLHFETILQESVQATRMLKSFHHLIKSMTLQHATHKLHPVDVEYIVKLVVDKAIDFKNLFFRKQLRSTTEKSHLKEYNFVRNGIARYLVEPSEDYYRTTTESYFFELTDHRYFAQKIQYKVHMNAVTICVNDSLPPETVPQLCLYAPKMEYLAVYHMGITNFDINELRGLKHLKVLNLSLCNATVEHLKCLHDLNVTIECLLIRDATVDDAFVVYIRKLKQIRTLVITDTKSFDENRLVQIVLGLPKLVTVVVDKKISADGLMKIQKSCPSLLELEIDGFDPLFKLEGAKKLLKSLRRLYISSTSFCESNSFSESVNSRLYLAQSIPAYNYMFENMATNY